MTPNHAAQLFFRARFATAMTTSRSTRCGPRRSGRLFANYLVVWMSSSISCRGWRIIRAVKKSTWCCPHADLEEHTFCTVSVDGEPFSRSRLRSYTHSALRASDSIEDGSHHGEVVSVRVVAQTEGQGADASRKV